MDASVYRLQRWPAVHGNKWQRRACHLLHAIALFGIPAVFVAFAKGGPALGFFALAAVPLLAPLNLFLSIAISSEFSVDQSLSTFIAGFIWAALSALLIWITATSRSRGET
jgi:hypothetical protein